MPCEFIASVFEVMAATPRHTYQILTKRPYRMRQWFRDERSTDRPLPNVWLGVSVEDQRSADQRIHLLLRTPAEIRFLSCEPLLGAINLGGLSDGSWYDREGASLYNALWGNAYYHNGDHGLGGGPTLDWVIVGGESGPGARAMQPRWVRSLRDQCQRAKVPFFFKQWGAWGPTEGPVPTMARVGKASAGRVLDGRTWDEIPDGSVAAVAANDDR